MIFTSQILILYVDIEAPKVKLKNKFTLIAEGANATLFPDFNGNLALIQVIGEISNENDDYLAKAKTSIVPVLNWLTMSSEQVLPIVQENLVKLPSGTIHFYRAKHAPIVTLTPELFTEHEPLRDAISLYRLGLNNNEPIYAFLSFYRAEEALVRIKNHWFKIYKGKFENDEKLLQFLNDFGKLQIPKHLVFGEYAEQKLARTTDILKMKYRNAIAHSHQDKKDDGISLLTGSDEEANIQLQFAIATIRYIVKIKIEKINEIFNYAKAN